MVYLCYTLSGVGPIVHVESNIKIVFGEALLKCGEWKFWTGQPKIPTLIP